MNIKALGKLLLCLLLEAQVRSLRRKNKFVIVAVVGSVGKTSAKIAIAQTLAGSYKVRYQDGNYNDRLTVPLALFNHAEPAIFNVFGWLKILARNQRLLQQPYPYDVAVVELGIDAPGQMRPFSYLQPELLVVTGISAEHLEYFKTLDVVAREELLAMDFSQRTLLNVDDVPAAYLPAKEYVSYGFQPADFTITELQPDGLRGQSITIAHDEKKLLKARLELLGPQGAKAALAAAAVGELLGMSGSAISRELGELRPVPGRMQILTGSNDATLIDDTYNASPIAVKAALDVLYGAETPQRIAILGSMNELGAESPSLHTEVGDYCDPSKLDYVITIGEDAERYLAPAARKRGCRVECFLHPTAAGLYVKEHLKPQAVVLAKGSQNRVFAEEALVPLLAHPKDAAKLVRQSPYWQARKVRSLQAS